MQVWMVREGIIDLRQDTAVCVCPVAWTLMRVKGKHRSREPTTGTVRRSPQVIAVDQESFKSEVAGRPGPHGAAADGPAGGWCCSEDLRCGS